MKKLILLIEDDVDIRENTAELLELEGFEVITAASGENALLLINELLSPDMIICDVIMGGIDGYQVRAAVQQNFAISTVPFIFSTAQAEKKDRLKAEDMGIAGYLIKPFDASELMAAIRLCLAQ